VGPAPTKEPLPSIVKDNFLNGGQRDALDRLLHNIRTGQHLHAIKDYRLLTGLGLRESKDAVVGYK